MFDPWRVIPCAVFLSACAGVGIDDSGGTDYDPSCDDGAPVDEYVAGLTRSSTLGRFELALSATPAPPDVGDNQFTVTLSTGDGPASSATIELRPWMPLHGHGSSPEIIVGADEGGGVYGFEAIDLFMPGLWELNFTMSDAVQTDDALYRFCLEG